MFPSESSGVPLGGSDGHVCEASLPGAQGLRGGAGPAGALGRIRGSPCSRAGCLSQERENAHKIPGGRRGLEAQRHLAAWRRLSVRSPLHSRLPSSAALSAYPCLPPVDRPAAASRGVVCTREVWSGVPSRGAAGVGGAPGPRPGRAGLVLVASRCPGLSLPVTLLQPRRHLGPGLGPHEWPWPPCVSECEHSQGAQSNMPHCPGQAEVRWAPRG